MVLRAPRQQKSYRLLCRLPVLSLSRFRARRGVLHVHKMCGRQGGVCVRRGINLISGRRCGII